jgi:hypothetical protein
VDEQGVQQRTQDTPLGGPFVKSQSEVLLPIITACGLVFRKSRIQLQRVVSRSQDPEFGVELGRNNIVE